MSIIELPQDLPPGTPAAQESDSFEDSAAAEVLGRLDQGTLSAESLTVPMRQRCVCHLTHRGYSSSEIASRLKLNQRTVRRYREAARREEAMTPDEQTPREMMGEFRRMTYQSIGLLRRMSYDPQTPAYARLWAQEAIGRTYKRFIDTARSMGYLGDAEGDQTAESTEPRPQLDPEAQAKLQAFLGAIGQGWIRLREPKPPEGWTPDNIFREPKPGATEIFTAKAREPGGPDAAEARAARAADKPG